MRSGANSRLKIAGSEREHTGDTRALVESPMSFRGLGEDGEGVSQIGYKMLDLLSSQATI